MCVRVRVVCALAVAGLAIAMGGALVTDSVSAAGNTLSADSSSGTLTDRTAPLLWKGTVDAEDAPTGGEPPPCATAPCDHFRLLLNLPPGTFQNPNKPGGLQVALRWFGNPAGHTLPPGVPGCCGEFDTLHLWIYKDGALRGSSPGIIAVSQSALVPDPENGWYDIWIQFDPSYNVAPSVDYEALAEVEFRPNTQTGQALLPDLVFRGTERITFATPSFPIFEPDPPPGSSCFLSETFEDGAITCLRFDQIVANRGRGPVEIAWDVPAGSVPVDDVELPVVQRVYASDGTFAQRPAGSVAFHGVHQHYHYSSFANALLWASDGSGARLGDAPVKASHKVSFCMADIRIDAWAEKGDGPRTYYAPDCLLPQRSDEAGDHYAQGINHGWADVYDWYIPDQYIEVSGAADGYYLLEFCADPFNEILESDETNNCIVNHIRLSGMGTMQQQVEVLGTIED